MYGENSCDLFFCEFDSDNPVLSDALGEESKIKICYTTKNIKAEVFFCSYVLEQIQFLPSLYHQGLANEMHFILSKLNILLLTLCCLLTLICLSI